jgi:hypothetical protein
MRERERERERDTHTHRDTERERFQNYFKITQFRERLTD